MKESIQNCHLSRMLTKIKKAKKVRENLGGENYHLLQCESIPVVCNSNLHGVHSEPCYKK